jgi:hypothetical protein
VNQDELVVIRDCKSPAGREREVVVVDDEQAKVLPVYE